MSWVVVVFGSDNNGGRDVPTPAPVVGVTVLAQDDPSSSVGGGGGANSAIRFLFELATTGHSAFVSTLDGSEGKVESFLVE